MLLPFNILQFDVLNRDRHNLYPYLFIEFINLQHFVLVTASCSPPSHSWTEHTTSRSAEGGGPKSFFFSFFLQLLFIYLILNSIPLRLL